MNSRRSRKHFICLSIEHFLLLHRNIGTLFCLFIFLAILKGSSSLNEAKFQSTKWRKLSRADSNDVFPLIIGLKVHDLEKMEHLLWQISDPRYVCCYGD
jgi:hypothetical protein